MKQKSFRTSSVCCTDTSEQKLYRIKCRSNANSKCCSVARFSAKECHGAARADGHYIYKFDTTADGKSVVVGNDAAYEEPT